MPSKNALAANTTKTPKREITMRILRLIVNIVLFLALFPCLLAAMPAIMLIYVIQFVNADRKIIKRDIKPIRQVEV